MNKGRFSPIYWTTIFLALVGTSGWNAYQNRQLRAAAATTSHETDPLLATLREARAYELAQIGKMVQWPDEDLKVFGEASGEMETAGYRLILVFNELSCDQCRDEETQFALAIARAMGPESVRIVVGAAHSRYVRSYMRLNSVHIPVYHDAKGSFFKENSISNGPLLLLISPMGEVTAAHWPIPGASDLCELFHAMCTRLFGMST